MHDAIEFDGRPLYLFAHIFLFLFVSHPFFFFSLFYTFLFWLALLSVIILFVGRLMILSFDEVKSVYFSTGNLKQVIISPINITYMNM